MIKKTLTSSFIAAAMICSATLLSAHTVDFGKIPAQAETPEEAILLAQTKTKDKRDERQDTRKDCREAEGAGKDKRDCKQDGRKN